MSARFASLERTVENRILDEVQKRWQLLIEKGDDFAARALPGSNQERERVLEASNETVSSSSFARMQDIDDLREYVKLVSEMTLPCHLVPDLYPFSF